MSFKKFIKKLCLFDFYNWKLIMNEILPKILVTLRILKVLMLKLMANFQVFQTIYQTNLCISTGTKTTANFLITDIETVSFIARDCMYSRDKYLWSRTELQKFICKVGKELFVDICNVIYWFLRWFSNSWVKKNYRNESKTDKNCNGF